MTRLLMHLGPFALRFWHRFGFAYHRKAWGRCSLPTFLPARRFSAGFGRSSRCANLLQNAGHHATHLLRGNRPLLAFPGTLKSESKLFAQQQLIASTGQQPTPAFHLFGGTQMRLFPKQILLEKTIAMFLREALAIPGAYLLQGHLLASSPHEPAFARVAFAVTGGFPLHADHTDLSLWGLSEMQLLPAR